MANKPGEGKVGGVFFAIAYAAPERKDPLRDRFKPSRNSTDMRKSGIGMECPNFWSVLRSLKVTLSCTGSRLEAGVMSKESLAEPLGMDVFL